MPKSTFCCQKFVVRSSFRQHKILATVYSVTFNSKEILPFIKCERKDNFIREKSVFLCQIYTIINNSEKQIQKFRSK